MPSLLRIPKVQLIAALVLIYLTAVSEFPALETFNLFFYCVGFCILFDLLFTYFRKRSLFLPYAAIATGLIMSLIIHQTASVLQIAVAAFLAMGIKNFLRPSGRHIFNPVASGLFLTGLLFGEYIGWWGVSFQNITSFSIQNLLFFLVLLIPVLISGLRFKKYPAILAYILVNTVLTQVFFSAPSLQSSLNTLLNPSTLFFTLVMLPEPMTSPVTPKNQLIYGAVIALIPFLFAITSLSEILAQNNIALDPLLFALLFGNLVFFKNK